MAAQPIVHIKNVTKNYRMGEITVHALRNMNLEIPTGEFLVLLGPSGSGKTTALNMIGGLDRPSDGAVMVEGEDITSYDDRRLTEYRRRKVGFVFQFFNLIPTLTARENVEFALTLVEGDGEPAERKSRELLGLVGMEDRADHFPSQLSGGEQQRVAIARSLAGSPSLLLCDELTGDLDVDTGQQVLAVVRGLNQEQGATVVVVTHNTAIAPMADHVVHLRDGSVDHIETNDEPASVEELSW